MTQFIKYITQHFTLIAELKFGDYFLVDMSESKLFLTDKINGSKPENCAAVSESLSQSQKTGLFFFWLITAVLPRPNLGKTEEKWEREKSISSYKKGEKGGFEVFNIRWIWRKIKFYVWFALAIRVYDLKSSIHGS